MKVYSENHQSMGGFPAMFDHQRGYLSWAMGDTTADFPVVRPFQAAIKAGKLQDSQL